MTQTSVAVTPERVRAAQTALRTQDAAEIAKYWSPALRFLVPGSHPFAGWRESLADFITFHRVLHERSGGSIRMEMFSVLVNEQYSIDMNHCSARRAGSDPASTAPSDLLRFDGVDVLKWEDGLVVEGYAAIFGDGTSNWSAFLS
jgi:uncharacterized protein